MDWASESTWEEEFANMLEDLEQRQETPPSSFWAGVRDHVDEGRQLLGEVNETISEVLSVDNHSHMVIRLCGVLSTVALQLKFFECKLAQSGM